MEIFYWNKSDLTSDDVILESNNELEESPNEKKNLILTLYDKGLLSDENGNISNSNKLKILNMLGFKNWESIDDIKEHHKARANKENLSIIKLETPIEIDDHEIHINEHTKFLISDQGTNLPLDTKNKFLEHIKQHKEYLII